MPGRLLSTLNLAYKPHLTLVCPRSDEKPLKKLMFQRCVFVVSFSRPSDRVNSPCMPVWSVEAREPEDVWMPVDESRVGY